MLVMTYIILDLTHQENLLQASKGGKEKQRDQAVQEPNVQIMMNTVLNLNAIHMLRLTKLCMTVQTKFIHTKLDHQGTVQQYISQSVMCSFFGLLSVINIKF